MVDPIRRRNQRAAQAVTCAALAGITWVAVWVLWDVDNKWWRLCAVATVALWFAGSMLANKAAELGFLDGRPLQPKPAAGRALWVAAGVSFCAALIVWDLDSPWCRGLLAAVFPLIVLASSLTKPQTFGHGAGTIEVVDEPS